MAGPTLTFEEKRYLLSIARETIRAALEGSTFAPPPPISQVVKEQRGAFVTLHKQGRLRGCIGTFTAEAPLYKTIQEMAISAAFKDPRFPPLEPEEFPLVELEISVLSPLEEIKDPGTIQVGTHGIYLINGPFHGVLLPQVATEYGWDRETFLDQTCLKAGMPPGCWKDPGTTILIFSAEVFSEDRSH